MVRLRLRLGVGFVDEEYTSDAIELIEIGDTIITIQYTSFLRAYTYTCLHLHNHSLLRSRSRSQHGRARGDAYVETAEMTRSGVKTKMTRSR